MSWKEELNRVVRKIYLKEEQLLLILIVVLGLLVGVFGAAFRAAIHTIAALTYEKGGWWLLSPAIGGLITGLIIKYISEEAKGSGITYVKRALAYYGGDISLKTTVSRFIASAINVGTGFSLGPEGPSVKIGAGIGSFLARVFHLSSKNARMLVSIGAGGGIAAAFFAPMAGVTYILEEIMGSLSTKIVGASLIATVLAAALQKSLSGDILIFSLPGFEFLTPAELINYALLGAFVAPFSVLFVKSMIYAKRFFSRLSIPVEWKLFATGVVISAVGFFFPQTLGIGYDTITEVMRGDVALKLVVVLLILKILLTSLSSACGGSGGIYAPVFFMGAFSGIFVAKVMSGLFPMKIASSGAYAIIGMGAFFAGVFRTPLTAFLIIFEMTRKPSVLFPLMLATGVSYIIASALYPYSATRALMIEEGSEIPSEAGGMLEEILVEDTMNTEFDAIPEDFTIEEVNQLLPLLPFGAYPVVDKEGNFVGMVTAWDIKRRAVRGEGNLLVRDITIRDVPHLHPDMPLSIAISRMANAPFDVLPVLDPFEHRKLYGVLSMKDFLKKIMEITGRE